jgi:hypothetical protein
MKSHEFHEHLHCTVLRQHGRAGASVNTSMDKKFLVKFVEFVAKEAAH